jgi:hypothetical protein
VVLEPDEGGWREVGEVVGFGVDDHVADEAFFSGFGFHVDHADAREALTLGGLVVVAQELVAAAYREHRRAGVHRPFKRWLLVLEEVFVHQGLLAVLAAAKEENVDVLHSVGGASTELYEPRVVVAPLGAL